MSRVDLIEIMPICELVRNSQLICIFGTHWRHSRILDKPWWLESRTIPQTIPFIGVGAFFRVYFPSRSTLSQLFRFIGMVPIPFSAYIENSWHLCYFPFLSPLRTHSTTVSLNIKKKRKIRQNLHVTLFFPAAVSFRSWNWKRLQHIAPVYLFFLGMEI